MQSDIGRFFEGRRLETTNIMRVIYDACLGQGSKVVVWVDGKELAFGTQSEGQGHGFIRMMPLEAAVILAFPRGHEIPDPQKRTSGVPYSRTTMNVYHPSDIDSYVRRMIDAAYALES